MRPLRPLDVDLMPGTFLDRTAELPGPRPTVIDLPLAVILLEVGRDMETFDN
jgi:hypothetical protein